MKKLNAVALGIAILGLPLTNQAAQGDWYIGAGGGWSNYNGSPVDLNPTLARETYTITRYDDTGTGWKIFGGYQFHQNFAVELAYTQLGKYSFDANVSGGPAGSGTEYSEVKPTCWSLSLVGILPLSQNFSLLGKAGVCRWDDRFRGWEISTSGTISEYPSVIEGPSSKGTDLTYGLGIRYDFTRNLGLRAEWERFENITHDRSSADLWSLNVQYSF